MNICIFGSSFNPPHNAHLQIIKELKKFNFDKIVLVPTGHPNHKQITIADSERIKMIEEFKNICKVDVSYHEMENHYEYTYESLSHFNFSKDTNLYFVIGGDSLNTLPTWDYFEELKKMLTFIIVERPGIALDTSVLNQIKYKKLDVKTDSISSTQLRENLSEDAIPKPIFDIIKANNLYQ